MKVSTVEKLLQVRILVGFLGESSQYGWWTTAFFQPLSKSFLEPVFARTSGLAQYHGVSQAARLLHDQHIGVGQVFHLFRLPEEIEREMHHLLEEPARQAEVFQPLTNQQAALEALLLLADGSREITAGPLNVGNVVDLGSAKILKEMARCYATAFQGGFKTYPYLLGARERA